VIASPPFVNGADHARETRPFAPVPPTFNGGDGTDRTVTDTDVVEYDPCPAAFTPATRNTYEVPLVRSVTVALVDVDVPSANVAHVDPLFDEN